MQVKGDNITEVAKSEKDAQCSSTSQQRQSLRQERVIEDRLNRDSLQLVTLSRRPRRLSSHCALECNWQRINWHGVGKTIVGKTEGPGSRLPWATV